MNHKGFVFTLMTLVFILAISALNNTIVSSRAGLDQSPEVTRLAEVSKIFRDVSRAIEELDLSTGKKDIAEAGLPFAYGLQSNTRMLVIQPVPPNPSVVSSYYNSLQGYRIFFEGLYADSNRGGIFVDINTITDLNWGSVITDPRFLISPSCTAFRVTKGGFSVESGFPESCDSNFDIRAIRRMDLNVRIEDPGADFDSVVCNNGPCDADPFNPSDPLPYLSVRFDDTDCPGCSIAQKTVSTHYDPAVDYNVFLSCAGPGCSPKGLSMVFGPSLRVSSDWNRSVDVNLALDFNAFVTGLRSLDSNFVVTSPKFSIIRSNRPLPQ
jgi:hypothetical protein